MEEEKKRRNRKRAKTRALRVSETALITKHNKECGKWQRKKKKE